MIFKTTISICIFVASASVFATIVTDINSQQPIKVIFDNALNADLNIAEIFKEIGVADVSLTPLATTYATCNKLDSDLAILDYAFKAVANSAELIEAVANAARKCGIAEEDLLSSALVNNIDPTTIGEATGAGISENGGTAISSPSFGSVGGSGGGGTASAN